MDRRGSPGDAPRPGVVPERSMGGVPGWIERTRTTGFGRLSCSIAGGELCPIPLSAWASGNLTGSFRPALVVELVKRNVHKPDRLTGRAEDTRRAGQARASGGPCWPRGSVRFHRWRAVMSLSSTGLLCGLLCTLVWRGPCPGMPDRRRAGAGQDFSQGSMRGSSLRCNSTRTPAHRWSMP